MLLDHGRLLVSERSAYGVQQLPHFMASHHDELRTAHVNCDHSLVEWAPLKEHMIQHCANVQMCKMWEALAPEKAHAQLVNVWCVLALLRTYCLAKAAVECTISVRGRLWSSMDDIVETHLLSPCIALHFNLPPLRQWTKEQGFALARHVAARARFDVRPNQRVSERVNARECVEVMML